MGGRGLYRDDDIDSTANQFRRQLGKASVLAFRRSDFHLDIFPLDIAKITKSLTKWPQGFQATDDKDADAPHRSRLLRARRNRPRRRRTAKHRDKLAADHSITSSARASSEGGISRPSALAVLRLTTSSY